MTKEHSGLTIGDSVLVIDRRSKHFKKIYRLNAFSIDRSDGSIDGAFVAGNLFFMFNQLSKVEK